MFCVEPLDDENPNDGGAVEEEDAEDPVNDADWPESLFGRPDIPLLLEPALIPLVVLPVPGDIGRPKAKSEAKLDIRLLGCDICDRVAWSLILLLLDVFEKKDEDVPNKSPEPPPNPF